MMIVPALVLLFLLKLRFPRDRPISNVLCQRYGRPCLHVFRKLEHTSLKLSKKQLDLHFLTCCKTYDVFPKFLGFKLYRRSLYNSEFYKVWQRKLLDLEIKTKKKEIIQAESLVSKTTNSLKSIASRLDYICLRGFVHRKVANVSKKVVVKHERKLKSIGAKYFLNSCDPTKVIFNYSSITLTARQEYLLSFGLSFCLPVFKLSYHKFFLFFESFASRLKSCNLANGVTFDHVLSTIRDTARATFYGFKSYKVFSPIFSRSDFNVLKSLGCNRDLVVCRPDKGNGVVLLDKSDYVSKMNTVLNDFTKFIKLSYDNVFSIALKAEDKVIRYINKLVFHQFITPTQAQALKPQGSSPSILYGLPKVHKASVPLRPIVAAYNSPTYKLSKFLVPILSPFTTNEYTIRNSSEFVNFLSSCELPPQYHLCSFDVTSLFTNIPIDETVTICSDSLFNGLDIFRGLTKSLFKNLLSLCVKDCLFIFNNQLYKQVDGVAMGSPLGPTFANVFLCHHEKTWLQNCPTSFKPLYYRRYVDDTFVIFKEKSHAEQFLNYINSQHANINFSIDNEYDKKLPFLDILVEKSSRTLSCSIYRKPTFSGLGTSFYSYCSLPYKISAIKTLLHRAYSLSSSYVNLHNEITFLRNFFYGNGFSHQLFDNLCWKFLNTKFYYKQPQITVCKQIFYVKIPYLGPITTKLQSSLMPYLTKCYPQMEFKFVPVNSFRIGSFFRVKDYLPTTLRSSIVYSYTCPSCQTGYLGSSIRAFKIRVDEHIGQSSRTHRPRRSPPFSAVREHARSCGKVLNSSHFKIIDQCNEIDLRILESLYIKSHNSQLNNMLSSTPLLIA